MDFLRILNRIRYIPPRRLARALGRRLARQMRRCYWLVVLALCGPHVSEQEFARALLGPLGSTQDGAPNSPAGLATMGLLRLPREGVGGVADVADLTAQRLLAAAVQTLERRFNLLGSGWVVLGCSSRGAGPSGRAATSPGDVSPAILPWHSDFKSGHTWDPRTFYKDIRYGHMPGVDVKVPWELSRCLHLVTLGQAYVLLSARGGLACSTPSGQDGEPAASVAPAACAMEFVAQVEDWIENNPPMLGVNWACTMDVAIRVCNWLVAWQLFQGAAEITDEFTYKFYRSLLEHGRFIRANLEYSETLTSNHYLSDIVGLLYLGILAPQFKEAEKWRDFARRELVREMEKQVYRDGFDFEASTCYHRLVLELFFYSAWLCRCNGIELPQAFWDRLYKMFEVVLYILKPNGHLPQLGDNDSARLHILYPREVLDGTYLLSYAAILFEDSNFKIPQFGLAPEVIWVFGRKGVEKWQALPARAEPPGSKAFPNAGVYVMRHNDDYMLISCGPNGQDGNGGHAHNDKLSFELCIGGEEVIVDPGTYVYTSYPEWRNRFRSTAYHNTVMVDGEEQNPIDEKEIFHLPDITRSCCLVWETGPEKDVFVGEHYGYLRLNPPLVHRRKVEFYKGERAWVITDFLYELDASSPAVMDGWREPERQSKPSRGTAVCSGPGPVGTENEGRSFASSGNAPAERPRNLQERAPEGWLPALPPRGTRTRHVLELNLHLAPEMHAVLCELALSGQAQLGQERQQPWEPSPRDQDALMFWIMRRHRPLALVQAWGWQEATLASGWYSPEYGRKEETTVLRLHAQEVSPIELRLVVRSEALTVAGRQSETGT